MQLRRKLKSLYRIPGAERRLVMEAVLALGLARLLVLFVPFRHIVRMLARIPRNPKSGANLSVNALAHKAVTIAARNVPWNAVCLPQAIATKLMLARRGYRSTLHLGVGRNDAGGLIGHAWLDAGGMTVVGDAGKESVTQVGSFD